MRELTFEEICRKLKPFLNDKADDLYLKYTLANSRDEKEQIQKALSILYQKYLETSLLDEEIHLQPPKESLKANYKLGDISYAKKSFGEFGLREKDWSRHVCITGMSGSGKTTFAFNILNNFIEKQKPFMVFDWKKSFRPLMNQDKNILCFTVGNDSIANLFRININKPPKGVGPREWVGILCDLIVESFFASYGVHKVFRETLDQAFRDFGVYGGSNNYPTWKQIKDRLEDKADELGRGSRRESEWMESSIRIADSLTFGSFGDAICSKDPFGLTVEDLLNKKILFELHALGNAEKKFFCEFLLTYIYYQKKSNKQEDDNVFKSAIIVDEAHHIFLKDKPNFVRESTTEIVYRELREYGISLICLDQHMSKISDVVAGNSATNIAFQQILPYDVDTVSGLMQLREHKNYFSMLHVGEGIVKLAERYTKPFLIKTPFIDTKKGDITDSELKDLMEKKSKELRSLNKVKYSMDVKNITKAMSKAANIYNKSGVLIDITKEHKDFMEVLSKKELATTKVYEQLELSARKCDTLKKDLIGQGLIEVEEITNQKGLKKVLKLTEKGTAFIEGM